MDCLGRIAEILVTVVLLFIVPLSYTAAKEEMLCQTYVTTETAYFVDSVRNTGFLSKQMYETYVKKLAVTNVPYKIQMSHYKKKMVEEEKVEAEQQTEEKTSYLPFYQGIYHEDLLSSLLDTEQYFFQQGDFFSVVVQKQGLTWGDRLESFLTGRNLDKEQIQVVYGGAVRDEIR